MKKIVVLLFLFSLSVGSHGAIANDDHEEFVVNIITSPREGPFRMRQQVNFSCVVDPEPPDNVTYQWRSVDSVYGGNTNTQQNISRRFYYSNLRFCWYFCEVMLNQTLIGSANRLVELSGIVYSTGPVVTSFRSGDRHILNVNLTDANYITSLAWYHNGTRITSDRRFTITNSSTSLIINNMRAADAGVYEVKIAAVNTESWGYPHYPECDMLMLPLLESLAGFAPVTFRVQESCASECNLITVGSNYNINDSIPGIKLAELRSVSQANITLFSQEYPIYSYWFRDGHFVLDNGMYNSTIILDRNVYSLQILYNQSDDAVGDYIGIMWTRTNALRYILSRQCRDYYYLVDYDLYIYSFPLALSYWKIRTPCTQLGSVNMQHSVLTRGEVTMIWCTTECENTNLTLWRNQELLSQVQGDQLNYTTTPYMYGSYQCGIGDKVRSNSSMLHERAYFQLLFIDQHKQCKKSWKQHYNNLTTELSNVFSRLCFSCQNISAANIQNVQVNCTEFMYLTADLVYSDPAGRITASTLLDMFSMWMISQENPSLVVNGQNLSVITKCPVDINAITKAICAEYVSASSERQVGSIPPITGAYFGGLVTGTLIIILACGIIFCVSRWTQHLRHIKKVDSPQVTEKTADIPMGTNQAYETVDVRYAAAERGREQDEVIYETPAS